MQILRHGNSVHTHTKKRSFTVLFCEQSLFHSLLKSLGCYQTFLQSSPKLVLITKDSWQYIPSNWLHPSLTVSFFNFNKVLRDCRKARQLFQEKPGSSGLYTSLMRPCTCTQTDRPMPGAHMFQVCMISYLIHLYRIKFHLLM